MQRMGWRALRLVAALACASFAAPRARAQEKNAGGLEPALEMRDSGIAVLSPVATKKDVLDVGLAIGYGRQPLLVGVGGGLRAPLVTDAVALHALASYGVFEDFDVGLDVPFYVMTAGAVGTPGRLNTTVFALGDVRVEPSYRIWGLDSGLFEVGVAAGVALPSGDQAKYAGAGLRGHVRAAVVVRPFDALELLGNAGVLDGPDAMGSLTWGAACLYELGSQWKVLAELDARHGYELQQISSLDVRGGVRWLSGAWVAQLAPSFALLTATGHAKFGGWASVGRSFTMPKLPRKSDADDDADGIANAQDGCRALAEDRDGHEDGDGCPEADDDGDGIVDARDAAPREAEDHDGVADGDGKPEAESAPAVLAVASPDSDADGVVDAVDICPKVSGSSNAHGCPDADADSVADIDDTCPAIAGAAENQGCPVETQAVLTADRIEFTSRAEFGIDSATLSPGSLPLIEQVAQLLRDNPSVKRVRIEGHADLQGESKRNLQLSELRAAAVLRALVERGVAEERLEAKGYGSTRPYVYPEVIEADRNQNRRVEFHIVQTDEEKP